MERPWLLIVGLFAATLILALIWFFASRSPIPQQALHHFSADFLTRAATYNRARYGLFVARNLVYLGTLVLLVNRSRPLAERALIASGGRPCVAVALLGLAIGVLLLAANLPFDLWRYRLDMAAGLAVPNLSLWASDILKSFLLNQVIILPGLIGLYFLVIRFPHTWHLLATLGVAFFMVISTALTPLIVDPLFYRFTPLEDAEMVRDITLMADNAGINLDEVLVMDASRRTTRVNAYFTGVGRTRRIVLYDNLLTGFPPGETLMVVAHEMGHWLARHIAKGIAIASVGAFILLWLIRFSVGSEPTLGHLPHALLVWALVSILSMPLYNNISRGFEREADRIAMDLRQDPSAWISLEKGMAERNLADVLPHPYIEGVLFTHPSILERIQTAEARLNP